MDVLSGDQPDIDVLSPPSPQRTRSGRPRRTIRLPARFVDNPPAPPTPLPLLCTPSIPAIEISAPGGTEPLPRFPIKTSANSFGLSRAYPDTPSYDPDDGLSMEDLTNTTPPSVDTPIETHLATPALGTNPQSQHWFMPFSNPTVFRLMNWMWNGSNMKSVAELDHLVNDVLLDVDFDPAHLKDFSTARETERMDTAGANAARASGGAFVAADGWREARVPIRVPDGKRHAAEDENPVFEVPGLHYRPLLEVIKSAVQDITALTFHWVPFKHLWNFAPDGPAERVYDELYSSEAWLEAHEELKSSPREPGCTLETAIVGLMFWSDSTHLANFGDASLWPIYLFFGNQSKWLRGKPRSRA